MIISSVTLENIRTYENSKIDFISGINFISGDVGSGKSSILIAIEFALFGFKRGDIEPELILRKGKKEASVLLEILLDDNSKIEIFRKIKKTQNRIIQDNGFIKIKNNILELSPMEINNLVFEILDFPKSFLTKDKNLIYRFSIYTQQESLKEIIFSDVEKRLEIIRKIFDIDKYKQIKDSTKIYLNSLRIDISKLKGKLENFEDICLKNKKFKENKDKYQINKEIENKKKEKIELAIKILENKLKKEKNNLLENNNILLDIEKKILIKENIENKINSLDLENSKININLKSYTKTDYKIQKENVGLEIRKIEIENDIIEKKQNKFKVNLVEFEILEKEKIRIINKIFEISQIEKELEILKKDTKNLKLIKNNQNKIEIFLNKIIKIDENLSRIKKEEEKMIKLDINFEIKIKNNLILIEKEKLEIKEILKIKYCNYCLQKINNEHRNEIKNKKEKIIIEKENDIKIFESKLQKIKANKKILIEKIKRIEELKQKRVEVLMHKRELDLKEKNINYILKKMDEKEKILEEFDKKNINSSLKNINIKLTKKKEIYDIKEDLDSKKNLLNKKLLKLKSNIFEFKLGEEKKQILENQLNRNLIEINILKKEKINFREETIRKTNYIKKKIELEKNISNNEKNISNFYKLKNKIIVNSSIYEKRIEEIEKELKINKKKDIVKKELEREIEKKLDLDKFLSSDLINITQKIERNIFTKFFIEFNEYFSTFFKKLIEDDIDVRLTEDFSVIVEQNGFDLPLKYLSGGEKSSVAIAYRLALKKIIDENFYNKSLNVLILDEPTDGFSAFQVDKLGDVLKSIDLSQIIIVSHDEKIEIISNNIIKLEKENNLTRILE